MIKPAQYLKRVVGLFFTQILRGDERAGIDIGEVDDVDAAGFSVVDVS